eukprot:SAG22_NODE_2420_length_2594_cov_2.162725_1_plen_108_part_00
MLIDLKNETAPVETHGPAGTVVLWHQKTVHIAGHNQSPTGGPTAVIRQAMIHDFLQTREAIPDRLLTQFDDPDMFRDWSEEFRALNPTGHPYRQWLGDAAPVNVARL